MSPKNLALVTLLLVVSGLALASAAGTAKAALGPPVGGETVIELAPSGAGRANALAYSPDGRWLAAGTSSGIGLYDAHSLAEARFIPTDTWVRSLAFSPDGQQLVTGSYDNVVRLWRVADGSALQTLAAHTGWVRSVAFSPDGHRVASASDDNTVRLWRASDGALLITLADGVQGPSAVAFSPDGQTLAAGGYDNQVSLWRVADGTLLRRLAGHTGWVRCLAFSPDGQTLASGGFDTTARLWRVADGTPLVVLEGHTASVLTAAFSPDGQTLATGSVDATVRLWRATDGVATASLKGHGDFVFAVAYAPDGQTLASGAVDNTVRLWPLSPEALAPYTQALQAPITPSACGHCHHPYGTLQSPTSARPARIVEMECATCHGEGALVRNWDPEMPRAPGPTTMSVAAPSANDHIGVPHDNPTLSVQIATPGNGEFIYSGGDVLALVPVAGRVSLAAGRVTAVVVGLELWSGPHQVAALTTKPLPDGSFTFAVSVNADEATLQVPIDLRDCLVCHDSTYENYPVGAYFLEGFPAGEVRLVVTAITADGIRAYDERWVTVDAGQTATFAVQAELEGGDGQVVGLPVRASTRLYEWRGRTFTGVTGADGAAHLLVEALSEVPTTYAFEVGPAVIAGRLYSSVEPVTVTVPAGAGGALPPVTLRVRAQAGQIVGRVAHATQPVPIHALRLPEGTRFDTQTTATGTFVFDELALAEYVVLADGAALAAQGLASTAHSFDLAQTPQVEALLATRPLGAAHLQGTVTDAQGHPLPFAWVRVGADGPRGRVLPESGAWALTDLAAPPRSVIGTAPGYYSRAVALPPGTEAAAPVSLPLVARPDLRWLTWGSGTIAVPAETQAVAEGTEIELTAGWLWGAGGSGGEAVVIHTAGSVITLAQARFALENVPGQTAWLYLLEGAAEIQRAGHPVERVSLAAGSMLALGPNAQLVPVPLDPLVLQGVWPAGDPGVGEVWEPTVAAQLNNRLALLGITLAQVVTFVTHMTVLMSLFAVPLVGVGWWMNRKHRGPETHS